MTCRRCSLDVCTVAEPKPGVLQWGQAARGQFLAQEPFPKDERVVRHVALACGGYYKDDERILEECVLRVGCQRLHSLRMCLTGTYQIYSVQLFYLDAEM